MRHDVAPDDPRYPSGLFDLKQPLPLRVRGQVPRSIGVAIVGSRDATPGAGAFARELARALACNGFAVWSGGARGIDTAAHEGALDAGGVTVIVSGLGLDHAYPVENAPLYDRVVESGGAIVSRFPDARGYVPGCFLLRNEVLAAATVATIVVQADLESGARSTLAAARRVGRPRACVSHAPWDEGGAGCLHEIVTGGAQLVGSIAHAVGFARHSALLVDARPTRAAAEEGAPGRPSPSARSVERPRESRPGSMEKTDVERLGRPACAVLDTLDSSRDRSFVVDELVEITGLGVDAVLEALLTLTLAAVVVEGPAGFYRRIAPTESD